MIKLSYNVLGVMSGTSLDGVDLAHIKLTYSDRWNYEFFSCETIPYSEEWLLKLGNLVNLTSEDLKALDRDYTVYLASMINTFVAKYAISNLDFISSHGHTALHQPDLGVTLQIGNSQVLSNLSKHTVICDFRVQDVALGGQGAPLVPVGDALLFPTFDYCLNLGGFANMSTNINGVRIAYDICPANIVLNYYVAVLGVAFDDAGNIAASGQVNVPLLNKLNNLDYYKQPYPKSLGLEWVKNYVFPCIDSFGLKTADILRTFVAHITYQIAAEITNGRTLVTGGGAYNLFLIESLKKQTKTEIVIPENKLIEYKEVLIFSLLGVLRIRNEVNCLASVTGAIRDHCSGKIYRHENY